MPLLCDLRAAQLLYCSGILCTHTCCSGVYTYDGGEGREGRGRRRMRREGGEREKEDGKETGWRESR